MKKIEKLIQKPSGQVLLATLLFCFIFIALFAGIYKAGIAYILKERSRRAVNLTALSAGAVYAGGLQLVRDSNILLMAAASFDAWRVGMAISAAALAPPPLDIAGILAAAKVADPHTRDGVQRVQRNFFGIGLPTGPYPALIYAQSAAVAGENSLLSPPLSAFNHETATIEDVLIPNMALRFRTADELVPDPETSPFSLTHDGIQHSFSSEEVEPAHNPVNPSQMRVRKDLPSPYAGWWVRSNQNGSDSSTNIFLSKIAPLSVLRHLKAYLRTFRLDVTDRDDPPCHTITLLGIMDAKSAGKNLRFYQLGEARITTGGLAAWDFHPIHTHLELIDLGTFPVLRIAFQKMEGIPALDQMIKGSGILNGL